MFLSTTVAAHVGIKQVGTFSSSVLILIFLLKFIGDINHKLFKKFKAEFRILLFGVFIVFFKIFIDQVEQITQVLFFIMVPMMVSVVLGTQNKLNRKVIRNLILFFFVAECFLAIYERIFFTNVFPYIEEIDEVTFENWSFRSTAFLGHPLGNAITVSTIMGFIVTSSMKKISKSFFMILGLIALLCFNARGALLIWIVLVVLFLYQMLRDKKTKTGETILILFFTILSAYFLYSAILDYGLGGRLLNEKINDGSAQTRVQVFDAFSYINDIDFWCGNAANYIPVMHKLGAGGVENSYIVLIINYGVPLFIVLFILYYFLIKRLLKKHTLFNKVIIISSFILVGSTNNGLAASTPWGFFILCAYSFPFLEKIRNENSLKNRIILRNRKSYLNTNHTSSKQLY